MAGVKKKFLKITLDKSLFITGEVSLQGKHIHKNNVSLYINTNILRKKKRKKKHGSGKRCNCLLIVLLMILFI